MKQAEFARQIKAHRQTVYNLLNDLQKPTPDLLNRIAAALDIPPETAYRAAGMLPARSGDPLAEWIYNELDKMSPAERKQAEEYIRFLARKKTNKAAMGRA